MIQLTLSNKYEFRQISRGMRFWSKTGTCRVMGSLFKLRFWGEREIQTRDEKTKKALKKFEIRNSTGESVRQCISVKICDL